MIPFTTLLSFWWVLPLVMMGFCLAMMGLCLLRMRKRMSSPKAMFCMMCGMKGWRGGVSPGEGSGRQGKD
jgi:hypothetical protein